MRQAKFTFLCNAQEEVVPLAVIRWAIRLVRRDLARRAAERHPSDLAPQSLAAIFLAVATPWVCLVIVLWASEHWIDAVVWLRRWRVAILGAGS
ncbi:MAG TPA: hypothetical protein VFF52_01070 [Isosphaeraceae bacterium]|nr:hypothetical protein [Isosphaeraceae bacterium]